MKRAGGKLRSLQKNQSVFLGHLPISAFVQPDLSEYPVRIQPDNLFFHGLGGYPYSLGKCCCAQCVVL